MIGGIDLPSIQRVGRGETRGGGVKAIHAREGPRAAGQVRRRRMHLFLFFIGFVDSWWSGRAGWRGPVPVTWGHGQSTRLPVRRRAAWDPAGSAPSCYCSCHFFFPRLNGPPTDPFPNPKAGFAFGTDVVWSLVVVWRGCPARAPKRRERAAACVQQQKSRDPHTATAAGPC
jgi:hypothetical protein